ncbi:MAG: hypothetical protein M3357_07910 [Actinomycetota bacterium]|nr:hypothetical protein [Actinomycetota bacterium]
MDDDFEGQPRPEELVDKDELDEADEMELDGSDLVNEPATPRESPD